MWLCCEGNRIKKKSLHVCVAVFLEYLQPIVRVLVYGTTLQWGNDYIEFFPSVPLWQTDFGLGFDFCFRLSPNSTLTHNPEENFM